jgi:hypothetical protein
MPLLHIRVLNLSALLHHFGIFNDLLAVPSLVKSWLLSAASHGPLRTQANRVDSAISSIKRRFPHYAHKIIFSLPEGSLH